MTSTALAPLKRTLKKAYALAYNTEQEMAGLVKGIDQIDTDVKEFMEHFRRAEVAAIQFMQTIQQVKMKAAEIKELESPTDKIADAIMVTEGMDSLLAGMPAYQLARELELVNVDNYQMAFIELSSYETGLERLTEIRDAAEKVMRERSRKLTANHQ